LVIVIDCRFENAFKKLFCGFTEKAWIKIEKLKRSSRFHAALVLYLMIDFYFASLSLTYLGETSIL